MGEMGEKEIKINAVRMTLAVIAVVIAVIIIARITSSYKNEIDVLTKKVAELKEDNKLLDRQAVKDSDSYERRIEALNKQISDLNEVIKSQEESLKKLRSESLTNSLTKIDNALTKEKGVFNGPSGKETYYNLPMKEVVKRMRRLGYDAEDYPYWERDDGCKMLGEYIMVACNLKERPYGTIVATSLGYGIVCDTGRLSRHQVDIATNW